MRQEVLTGVERRRRWSREDKLRILSEVSVKGASVAEVARRHDVTRQHLYEWRRELRRKHLAVTGHPALVPVEVPDHPGAATAIPAVGRNIDDQRIEIVLCNGRIVRASTGLSDAVLMRLIRLAEAA
ncbi:IS66-like element accessory protein TnpA [Microvirga tunisiensis]|uniref:Transposase n=1 Tax=Microvirga tunisiensis TaxID=2108360 RepID=A0A5N7NA47_9HYPH|nr:transposase [Microvirga tunisiensis]MPR13697.1 transposase [Microvirga tunisiensis]MPR31536.1 transposase [Microvirga tunisiensis]